MAANQPSTNAFDHIQNQNTTADTLHRNGHVVGGGVKERAFDFTIFNLYQHYMSAPGEVIGKFIPI